MGVSAIPNTSSKASNTPMVKVLSSLQKESTDNMEGIALSESSTRSQRTRGLVATIHGPDRKSINDGL